MDKYIPYEKLSKKKQREICAARRRDWGTLNPVTRRSENIRVYNRKKKRKDCYEEQPSVFYLFKRKDDVIPAGVR